MKAFFSALRFLTLLPVPLRWCGDEQDFNRSPDWYPVAGLVMGGIIAVGDLLWRWLLPLPVASVLTLVFLIAISGALHLDGLADTADAFFSSRGREQMLVIMKDSSAGPMGVTAIVLIMLLKLTLILSLPLPWRLQALVLMPLAGRCVMPVLSSTLPYARHEGTGAFIQNGSGMRRVLLMLAGISLAAFVFLGWTAGVAVILLFALSAWLLTVYYRYKIGGFTGDTLGAACELLELLPPLCVICLVQRGIL